jgi:ATP-binding cassette subfamily A (ABC1) protein 3
MNHGQVKCCGSPLFLKNTFGSGYRLTLAKDKSFDEGSFKALLNQNLADKYAIESNIAAELTVAVPFGLSHMLPNLLTNIESNKGRLGIDGYGISSPTIEEVFIK